jgi:hypothetical protein
MTCSNLSEMMFEFKILVHDKVAIQIVNTHELMKRGGGFSLELSFIIIVLALLKTETKHLNLNSNFKFKFKS